MAKIIPTLRFRHNSTCKLQQNVTFRLFIPIHRDSCSLGLIKWNIIWGLFITSVFLVLLFIRLDFFSSNPSLPVIDVRETVSPRPPETWMNIYQQKNKIGVIHRTFSSKDNLIHITETVSMRINTMGVTQSINISTQSDLNPDMSLSSFNFDLTSSLFRFNAHGQVIKNKLILFTGTPGAQNKNEIALKDIPHLSGTFYEAAFHAGLEKDMARSFSIFDPSTLVNTSIKVTRNADEIIPVMGKHILTQKYCADFMGAKNCAWLDKTGEVLKESGILGLSMEKVSEEKAREGISSQNSIDFTQIASIPVGREIAEPVKLTEIKIKLSGLRNLPVYINGDRQTLRQNVLTVTKEKLPAAPAGKMDIPENISTFLNPSPLVQSDHLQIKTQAGKIVLPTDPPLEKVKKTVNWVYANVEKKPVLSVPNALEVLTNKVGDCNEHAVLAAALLRAAGIPAQIETGLVYLHGRFYYHAWNIAYVGKWVTADAVFNQLPADVTHIRLVRGDGSQQLDLLGVMGKIKMEVISEKQ